MEKIPYISPDSNLKRVESNNIIQIINNLNEFVEGGLGVSFTTLYKEFVNLYGENLIINVNQVIVPSIDQCVRNLFAHKLSKEISYRPVSIPYTLDSFKSNNPEKLLYITPIKFGKNKIKYQKLLPNISKDLDGRSLESLKVGENSLSEYWNNILKDYKGFNTDHPDIGIFWDKITRIILEEKKKRLNQGNSKIFIDIKITYNGKNYFCSFSKKKNAYSTKKVEGLEDYTSIDELLNNENIKLGLPAKLYYPYVYLPLALFMKNFIIDYELDTTGLLDNTLVKEFFRIADGKIGLIDLGDFYKGTFVETEQFKAKIKVLLGELAEGVEDENWLALSSMIDPEVYNKIYDILDQIKLTTPKKTSQDIINCIGEELKNIL